MSYSVHVLCGAPKPVNRAEIIQFIKEGVYFDKPRFEPERASAEAASSEWDHLFIYERPDSEIPFAIHLHLAVKGIVDVVDATFFENGIELPTVYQERLKTVKHVYEFEFDRGGGITEDAWAMLACVQAFLAGEYDGFIFSSEEGIYNEKVQLTVPLSRRRS